MCARSNSSRSRSLTVAAGIPISAPSLVGVTGSSRWIIAKSANCGVSASAASSSRLISCSIRGAVVQAVRRMFGRRPCSIRSIVRLVADISNPDCIVRIRCIFSARMLLLLIALLLVGGGSADAAQRKPGPKPRPIQIVEPGALAIDYQGGLAVADRKLNRVVRIDLRTGARRILVAGLREIAAVTYDDQFRLYVGSANRIYRIDGRRKVLLAGTATRAYTGDGGPATAASLDGLGGFDVDHDETIVLSDYGNRVRFIGPDGKISTIAGTGEE